MLVERPNATGLHEGRPNVEAFVNHGSRVVYVVRQGVTLQGALKGRGVFDYALAAIIWHEMAHIDGADEPVYLGICRVFNRKRGSDLPGAPRFD